MRLSDYKRLDQSGCLAPAGQIPEDKGTAPPRKATFEMEGLRAVSIEFDVLLR